MSRRLSIENFHLPPGAQRRLSRMSIVFQPEVWNFKQFGIMIFVLQAMFIIFYGVFLEYHPLVAMPTKFEQREKLRNATDLVIIYNGTVVTHVHTLVTEAVLEEKGEKLEKHLLPDYYASKFWKTMG